MPRPSLASSSVLIATWFGAGYLPKAPGTWGSLAALPFAWIIMQYHGFGILIGASIALFFVGIWSANGYMAQTGT
ncbi:MAG: phosphatidylglycerophosphatase A, partial [Rhodospirillales bacterium]|nr:phosphatidylglycerophosphatase A [Rhodospirillales bacterium]